MTPEEAALATEFYEAIQHKSNYSERSQQSADFRIGMSDLGWCSELVRRMLAGIPEPPTDKLDAFIGTAIGDHVEQAWCDYDPYAIRHAEVSVTFKGDHGDYVVSGHPDLILPDRGIVVDAKTKYGLRVVERTGPNLQQQFQRHGYALGAYQQGMFGDMPLEEVLVANVWVDRTGEDERCHVQMEPFDQQVIDHAAAWIDNVVYAYLHDEVADKEPPREMCAKVCGHFATCRALDTDVSGLLTDPEVLTSIDMYREAQSMASEAEKMKKQAKSYLREVSGSTGTHFLRWTWVNDSLVPEHTRKGYYKIDLKPIK